MNSWKILTLLMLLLSAKSWSQSTEFGCASDQKNDSLILHDPIFSRGYYYMENAIQQAQSLSPEERTDDIYTIPVVVHVIHEGEAVGTGSNISDEQIFSAIEAMNDDFRKLPGTPGFGDGVDVGMQFCLAVRDPFGNASTGIVRVNGTVVTDYADMGIEATSDVGGSEELVKGLSTWPRAQYMNIWVVNEIEDNNAQSGVQGYAYFPVNSPLDGIVVLHNAFGTVGNLKPNTSQNRTITHEMGHSFALYHTFHNTSTCTESNCTTGGDKVCDTPITTLNGSCSSPACSGNQQVENYLDYTPESCKNMFTEGQKVRMRTALENNRASLLNSLGCMPVSNYDAGISAIISPNGNTCENSIEAEVNLTNYGSITLTSATIHYNLNGVGNNTYNWTGSLVSGMSSTFTLPSIIASTGSHTIYVWSTNPNGMSDQYMSNDQATSQFGVAAGSNAMLLVELDFFGTETTWEIKDESQEVVATGGPYVNNQQGLDLETNLCLPGGCYVLHMYDSYGDGQSFTQGDFTLYDAEGTQLAFGSGNWGEESTNAFCLEEIPVVATAPLANFSITDNYVCRTFGTTFNDLSTNSPTTWTWTFEGGTPSSSTSQNPGNILYNTAGTFDVTLVASNPTGTNTYVCANCVTVSAGPTVSSTGVSPACNNGSNGSVTNIVTGNNPFTYSWNSGQSTQNLTSLAAGTYTVTVTDVNGCTKQTSTTLSNPSAITISQTITHVSCNGESDGSIVANATGGAGNYSYSWNTGAVGNTISGVSGGIYIVTATDASTCIKTKNITVNEPTTLVLNFADFDIACGGTVGSAQVSPSGGSTPYSVLWSNGSTANGISNLVEGNYSVALTDSHGCTEQSSFAITSSPSLAININDVDVSCFGDNNGSATALASGGNGVYTYNWSNGATGVSVSGLSPGTYAVDANDSAGCNGTVSVTISEPTAPALAVFKTDISCHGMADGTATATASGGTGVFQYQWSNGSTSSFTDGMQGGTYLVTATDINNCSINEAITIVEPSLLTVQVTNIIAETCANQNGSATINCMGGTPVYNINWSNGATGQINNDLIAGSYEVLVADANDCSTSISFNISYQCDQAQLITQIVSDQCNQSGFALNDIIYCNSIANAEMYQWRFTTAVGDLLGEQYSLSPAFYIMQIPGITAGLVFSVEIKVLANNEWGPLGPACTIGLESGPDVPIISDNSCGGEISTWNDLIDCSEINGSFNYEWKITGQEYEFTVFTSENQLEIKEEMLLQPGNTYQVQVRCGLGQNTYTDWSSVCEFTISTSIGVLTLADSTPLILFFPNPSEGKQIFFDFSNLGDNNTVEDLMIFNTSGNLVEQIDMNSLQRTGNAERHNFRNPLASGLYLIRYKINGLPSEEKMIVR